jgi:hypothetical protein
MPNNGPTTRPHSVVHGKIDPCEKWRLDGFIEMSCIYGLLNGQYQGCTCGLTCAIVEVCPFLVNCAGLFEFELGDAVAEKAF